MNLRITTTTLSALALLAGGAAPTHADLFGDLKAKGLLQGGDGKWLNLKGISSKLKTQACDYVLKNASSLV